MTAIISENFRLGSCYGPSAGDNADEEKFADMKVCVEFQTNDTEEQCERVLASVHQGLKNKIKDIFHPEREIAFMAAMKEAGGTLVRTEANKELFD